MGEMNWVYTGLVFLAVSLLFYTIRLVSQKPMIHEFGWGFMALSLLCLGISLFIRSTHAQYFALSNMYESLLVVCMSVQVAFLCFDRWFNLRALGFPVTLLLLVALVYDLTLPTDIKPLQPALQSYWRSIHVPIILLSYAMFTLAFLNSVVYLVKFYWLDAKAENISGGTTHPKPNQLAMATGAGEITLENDLALLISETSERSNIYDEITYRCVAFGFPLLMVGIILGGMWANEAWGNYWSWDPKESMSLVTLLAYGVYLHLRVNKGHPPVTLAWVSVAGFALMLVTYFGVNLMGLGLHSYGKIG